MKLSSFRRISAIAISVPLYITNAEVEPAVIPMLSRLPKTSEVDVVVLGVEGDVYVDIDLVSSRAAFQGQ